MGALVFEWRVGLVAVAAAVVVLPVWPASAVAACESADDYSAVDGLGLACATGSGWWIRLDDGTRIFTHGFDPLPSTPRDDGPSASYLSPPLAPPCVANPATEYHNFVLYTRPSNKPDRYAEMLPLLRSMAAQTNSHLRNEAAESGEIWASYKFRCLSGEVEVANLALSTPSQSDNFGTLVSNVRSLGYASALAHYWIWHDDGLQEGAAGIAELYGDDRATQNNANNFGPRYAATLGIVGADGASGAFVMMHENGHNMGAVQITAPFSSRLGHCNDDADIMCYLEMVGGPVAPVCLDREHFDCGHNDYFDPTPTPLTYLSNHWNIGSRVNRFLAFSDAPPLPLRPTASASLEAGTYNVTVSWTPHADAGDSALAAFRVYGGSRPHTLARLGEVAADVANFVDVSPGGVRYYRVAAVNEQGEGSPSALVEIETPPAPTPPQPPGVPLGVTARPSAPGLVVVSWLPPADVEDRGLLGYRVMRSNGAFGGNFLRGDVPAGQTTFEDAVPTTGTFGYTVLAYSDVGEGEPSVKAVVLAPGP